MPSLLSRAAQARHFHDETGGGAVEEVNGVPVTGVRVEALLPFDEWVASVLRKEQCPGASFAFVHKGRLLYARGFGHADPEAGVLFTPTTLCRIGSTSKPVTAAAVMTLVRDGKLSLDDTAFRLLGVEPFLRKGAAVDPRLWMITVRHLLQHTAGFAPTEPGTGREYWWAQQWNADAMGLPMPLSADALVRYGMGLPLESDPGSRHSYSNFGYLALGRVVEKVSGRPYEEFVKGNVLGPLGVRDMAVARTRLSDRRPGEARYFDLVGGVYKEELSVLPESRGRKLPLSYGGAFYWESADACGGWLASAVDLARFVAGAAPTPGALSATRVSLFNARLRREVSARPSLTGSETAATYYGLGWYFDTRDGDRDLLFYHHGAVCGAGSVIHSRFNGVTLVGVFNADTSRYDMPTRFLERFHPLADEFDASRAWPSQDPFPQYP